MSSMSDTMHMQGFSDKSMSWDRQRKLSVAYYGHGSGSRASIRRGDQYLSSPSFSSTLLDAIYRSIDEGGGSGGGGHPHQQQHQIDQGPKGVPGDYQRRPCGAEKVAVQRSPVNSDLRQGSSIAFLLNNSSSSSSDSSSNKGRFSSSDSENSSPGRRYSSSCYSIKKLKPIRTSITTDRSEQVLRPTNVHKQERSGVAKAKSKALKIYGEFMKVSGKNGSKLPISPGYKLSNFLNSLFNAKKPKLSSRYDDSFPAKASSPACSFSFSRSCLSKTPSRGKLANDGAKRSVRFGPVSVVVDNEEDHSPCTQKTTLHLHLGDRIQELGLRKTAASVKGRPGEEIPTKNYLRNVHDQGLFDVEDQEDGDRTSCASSDLFELENLSGIGGYSRYSKELPVYETTSLDTNRAIASG
ncbi:hypothetical protein SAY87_005686 [Trapa incisa]|uniref:Uncharacterized protein n=1 Tax=Trapa incisa TaxID=236973 RepID=A0AAN7KA98_9MYRT|nr:hypothetical protein SAY87_005686 [Trapa incisa]